jgi:hypothetical protein
MSSEAGSVYNGRGMRRAAINDSRCRNLLMPLDSDMNLGALERKIEK